MSYGSLSVPGVDQRNVLFFKINSPTWRETYLYSDGLASIRSD